MEKINNSANNAIEKIRLAIEKITGVVEKKLFARHMLEIMNALKKESQANYYSLIGHVKFALNDINISFNMHYYNTGVFLLKNVGVFPIHASTRIVREKVFEHLESY